MVAAPVRRGDFHLPGLEFARRHRHRLHPGDLRFHQLHLLRLEREVSVSGAVPLRQGQAPHHAPQADRIREQLPPEFRRYRPILPPHAHLSRRLTAGEIHDDRHRPLIDAHLAHNQRALLQRHRLNRRTLHPPPSSFTTTEMLAAISCPPIAIFAWYLNVPGLRSTAGFGTPTVVPSTFLDSVTVFGSTVISARRLTTSGVPPAW